MPVRVERSDRMLTVIQSRPEARNAVDPAHAQALYEAFVAFDTDDSADVAVFWGEGGAFCAGADLKSLAARGIATAQNRSTHPSLEFPTDGGAVPRGPMGPTRLRLGKPVIAAIEGPAVAGGLELALWADCRVMAEGAYVGVYNRRWGVAFSDGGTVRLPRLVGEGRALEMIMTGRKVDAEECLRIGLCERLVPEGHARQAAEAMAREIARFPQASLRADRRSVYLQYGLSERAALEREWTNCAGTFKAEGAAGAARFAAGAGRHGDFANAAPPRA
jgi:enoyl-CoA hydratase